MKPLGIALIFGYVMLVGWVARTYGLSSEDVDLPEAPTSDPGLFTLVSWFWDNLKGFFAITTFQIEGIHELASAFLLLITLMVVWAGLRLLRGSG